MVKKSVRLPAHIKPERYQLMLRPDLENFTFSGEETIELILEREAKEITLHSQEIEIESAEFIHQGKTNFASKITYQPEDETATFNFPKSLKKGKGELVLKFKGILNDKLRGFYRSRYSHEGQDKYLATTQFEATDARRAFPSFDEPSKKAIFDVTLMIPANTIAISNTIEKNVWEHESGYKVVEFEPTPKMSTYLLAFIVGDLEYIEGKTKRGVLVRVFTTPGKKEQGRFALNTAIKMLEFYEEYFKIPYPLPVSDLIAIPDFAAGAMENWGAVTYRETALLIDEANSSAVNRQRVAVVIAHELAHMWFGDLVTMEWWTHLWLNEGFASYIEYLAVDHVFPEFDIWTQFIHMDQGTALKLDSLENTHPIEVEVFHPSEISEIFDKVSYSKGASIIRMLAQFLGPKDFREGLRHYLKTHEYLNSFIDINVNMIIDTILGRDDEIKILGSGGPDRDDNRDLYISSFDRSTKSLINEQLLVQQFSLTGLLSDRVLSAKKDISFNFYLAYFVSNRFFVDRLGVLNNARITTDIIVPLAFNSLSDFYIDSNQNLGVLNAPALICSFCSLVRDVVYYDYNFLSARNNDTYFPTDYISNNTYVISGIDPSVDKNILVTATDLAGNESTLIINPQAPEAPSNLYLKGNKIYWQDNSQIEDRFEIYGSTDGYNFDFIATTRDNENVYQVGPASEDKEVLNGGDDSVIYTYYRVRACFDVACSGYSNIAPPYSNQPPSAVAQISLDGITYSNAVTVSQGVPVSVYLSASDSSDSDGWTSSNGVSSGGKCEWNTDLNQDPATYEQTVSDPAAPSACNVYLGQKTFNDLPGTYTYNV
ncbi:hypothetical protein HYS97_01875, partial [Candidatus Daviesbacteria bacterium]|nr:hypothetical protein [Candidatus Daviesbacteria bacterium]